VGYQGRNNKEISMAEVKMDSRETAHKIRKRFAEMKRTGSDLGRP
jgi:hypothetical protein